MKIEELSASQFNWVKPHFVNAFLEQKVFDGVHISMLQLGTFAGDASEWLANNVNGNLIDVDPWDTDLAIEDYENSPYGILDMAQVESLYDQKVNGLPITKFKGTTEDFFKQNKDTFDFIYIDASHTKKSVAYDLDESWKILNSNGVIACDDYLWGMDFPADLRPYEAINEFVEKHSQEISVIINDYQYWFKKI